MGDASANAYLLVTGLLAAVGDGLERRPPLPGPASIDVGHLSDAAAAGLGHRRLPAHPAAALDALVQDEVLCSALGPVIAGHYPQVKRFELELFEAARAEEALDDVTDWERAAYLEAV